ncbi:MAG TPA: ATP-binding cassette domain-containing protein [Conexibacter sp.]|nr:ATP-binding cassette domain-containing protein [Conexibacter sp.]
MSLLALEHATKRFSSGQRETHVLRDVTLELHAGELVAVYGLRRSGRTTLLRVAAGILPLDEGTVRFEGRDLTGQTGEGLGVAIGYCSSLFDPAHGGSVADHVAIGLLARGVGRTRARAQAEDALERAGALGAAHLDPRDLHLDELVRAGIARALVTAPRLLLLDEPTNGVDVHERDGILALLRGLADAGTAILMTIGEPVACADRVLALDHGQLRGDVAPDPKDVVALPPRHVEPVA